MRRIAAVLVALSMCACVTAPRSGSSSSGVVVSERRCPPAHHWESGVGCVHNGKAKGLSK